MALTRIRKSITAITLSTLAMAGAITLTVATPAHAVAPDTATANAYGAWITLLGGTVAGPIPQVTLPANGVAPPAQTTIPLDVSNLLDANALNASITSTNFGTASEDVTATAGTVGSASTPGLNISGILDVQAIQSECDSNAAGSTGSTQVVGLSIGGAAPLIIPNPIPPNFLLPASVLGPLAGLVTITLNAQTRNDRTSTPSFHGTAITVDAIQVTLLSVLGSHFNTSITVGHSACSATGTDIEVPPTVTSVTPKFGPIAGGTPITITGSGFLPGSTVSIGGTTVPAANVHIVSPTTITTTTPAHAAGTVHVVVTNTFGASTPSAADQFTYEAQPTINVTGVSPLFGPTAGGQTVTVTGTNFGPDAVVTFGGNAATGVVVNAGGTSLTAVTPPGAVGPVPVVVTDAGGTATAAQEYTYIAAPAVTSFTPLFGPIAGGTPVTITGSGFLPADQSGTSVTFGGAPGTSLTVVNPTTITVTTPAHAAGPVSVTVTDDGGSVTPTTKFTYVAVPVGLSMSPTSGPTDGGTPVTITATRGLTDTTSVTFGGVPGTNIVNTSDTSITVDTPPSATLNAPSTVTVVVTSGGGTASPSQQFSYFVAPVKVTSVTPNVGPVAGGIPVVITGQGFTGVTSVKFGTASATGVTAVSDTVIDATVPASALPGNHAGPVFVEVTAPGGTSPDVVQARFTYEVAPTVTSISPTVGPTAGGQTITIVGTGFGPDTTVTLGTGASAAPATNVHVAADGNSLTAVTGPHAAGQVDVKVIDAGGTATLPNGYTYQSLPSISATGVNPTSGPTSGGQTVTITGSGLTGTTSVLFGANPVAAVDIDNVSDTEVMVKTPAGAPGPVSISLTTAGGSTVATQLYTYVAAPTILSFTPTSGSVNGSTLVTFTGTNLSNTTEVDFGATPGTGIASNTATGLTVLTPSASAAGPVTVTLKTAGGTATAPQPFTYIGVPAITSLNPDNGPAAGGTVVTITGTSLTNASKVTFGGTAGTNLSVASDSSLTVTTPPGTPGGVPVVVTTPGGVSPAGTFTYNPASTLTTINPTSGPTAGGTPFTITGTSFLTSGTTTVDFGTAPATGVVVSGTTTITGVTPAGSAGPVTVTVINNGGTSNGLTFTYIGPPVVGANGLNPAFGPLGGGTTVVITGSNLAGTTAVHFGANAATIVGTPTATTITVTDPASTTGPGPVSVTVTALGITATAAEVFTYVAVPTISLDGIVPDAGPIAGGTPVTITGTGFAGPTTVSFGANAATSVVVVSGTEITAVSPASTTGAGVVQVTVTDAGGTSGPQPFTYKVAPVIFGISPTSGPLKGGEPVNIVGANLCGSTSVTFGANNAPVVSVTADCTTVVVTEPAGTGTVPVVLTTTGGSARSPENFTYIQPGYWLAATDGGVFAFGGAKFMGSVPGVLKPGQTLNSPIVAMADTPDHGGYWLFAADGGVFCFGDAPFYGSVPGVLQPGQVLNGPVVTAEATPDGGGYREFAADGGVFDFGDAVFEGSLPGQKIFPTSPIAGATAYPFGSGPNPNNAGYWLVGASGKIFPFGNAPATLGDGEGKIFGKVVALATTPTGQGYFMFLQSGPVAAFGDAPQKGGAAGTSAPIVFGQSTSTGQGYWEFASDGGVFDFGDAPFEGSLGGVHLNAPITAGIAFGSD